MTCPGLRFSIPSSCRFIQFFYQSILTVFSLFFVLCLGFPESTLLNQNLSALILVEQRKEIYISCRKPKGFKGKLIFSYKYFKEALYKIWKTICSKCRMEYLSAEITIRKIGEKLLN